MLPYLIGVISFICVCVEAVPETRHLIETDYEGNVVHLDVTFDMERKIVMAIVGDVSHIEGGVPTVNLHDYNTGYGVLKSINERMCILAHALVPMATPENYRIGVTNAVHPHSLKISPKVLTYTEVKGKAGTRIASFCKDYNTFFAVATPINQYKRDTNSTTPVKTKAWCVFSSCEHNLILDFFG